MPAPLSKQHAHVLDAVPVPNAMRRKLLRDDSGWCSWLRLCPERSEGSLPWPRRLSIHRRDASLRSASSMHTCWTQYQCQTQCGASCSAMDSGWCSWLRLCPERSEGSLPWPRDSQSTVEMLTRSAQQAVLRAPCPTPSGAPWVWWAVPVAQVSLSRSTHPSRPRQLFFKYPS
jgi:hypothetical protein